MGPGIIVASEEPIGPYDRSLGNVAVRGELLRLAFDPDYQVLGVFDGAIVENLPQLLNAAGLAHCSLLAEGADAALEAVALRLVDPIRANFLATPPESNDDVSEEALAERANHMAEDMRSALEEGDPTGGGVLSGAWSNETSTGDLRDRVEAMAAIEARAPGAAVFWVLSHDADADTLWNHLRRVCRTMVPGAYVENADPVGDVAVLLRHADGNVLTELLHVLSPEQATAFLGPAFGLIFRAPHHPDADGSPVRRVVRSEEADPIRLPLWLTSAQMERLEEIRLDGSREKVGQYLRDVYPPATELDRTTLQERIRAYEEAGDRMGLRTERSHMKWAYLMAITEGGIDAPETFAALHETEASPDTRIDDVLAAADEILQSEKAS